MGDFACLVRYWSQTAETSKTFVHQSCNIFQRESQQQPASSIGLTDWNKIYLLLSAHRQEFGEQFEGCFGFIGQKDKPSHPERGAEREAEQQTAEKPAFRMEEAQLHEEIKLVSRRNRKGRSGQAQGHGVGGSRGGELGSGSCPCYKGSWVTLSLRFTGRAS